MSHTSSILVLCNNLSDILWLSAYYSYNLRGTIPQLDCSTYTVHFVQEIWYRVFIQGTSISWLAFWSLYWEILKKRDNERETWTIKAPSFQNIRLKFTSVFSSIENSSLSRIRCRENIEIIKRRIYFLQQILQAIIQCPDSHC